MSEAHKPGRKRLRLVILVVVAAVIVGGIGLFFRGNQRNASAQPTERPAVVVTVEPVAPRSIRRTITVVGSLYGRDEITLTPKVDGPIVELFHDVGDVVKPGEALLQIDPTDYRLAVDEAKRALELELARVGLTAVIPDKIEVKNLPAVVRAAALERNALDKRIRVFNIVSSTPEDRDQANTDVTVASANYRQSILDAETVLATVRQRQAVLATAEQRLKDTRIVVPLPQRTKSDDSTMASAALCYMVSQRSVGKGEIVRTGFATPMFKLILDHTLKLQAQVPERYLSVIEEGQAVELQIEAFPERRFIGQLVRIGPSIDRLSRTFSVEICVPNPGRLLRAGCFARAEIIIGEDKEALTVPEESIVSFAGVTKVFVVVDGVAKQVIVAPGVGIEVGDKQPQRWIEVKGDLSPKSLVVTSGQSQLADSVAVRIREAPASSGK